MKSFNKLSKTFIIAEAGVNHNGSLKQAIKLINIASDAKVDAIKFQIFDPDQVCVPGAQQAKYQKKNSFDKDQLSMLRKLKLDQIDFIKLKKYTKKKKFKVYCYCI